MKISAIMAAIGALLLMSCATYSDIWERERTSLATLTPAAEAAVASARSALVDEIGAAARCYDDEVEAAGEDFSCLSSARRRSCRQRRRRLSCSQDQVPAGKVAFMQ